MRPCLSLKYNIVNITTTKSIPVTFPLGGKKRWLLNLKLVLKNLQ